MTPDIALLLAQDGITNGAIYALLALALVLAFAVTRVIFIPQGEFVAYGALTLVAVQTGRLPGTVWLLLLAGGLASLIEIARSLRARSRCGRSSPTCRSSRCRWPCRCCLRWPSSFRWAR